MNINNDLDGFKPDTNDFPDKGMTETDIKKEVQKHSNKAKKTAKSKAHPLLKKSLIDILPPILKEGMNTLQDDNDKLVFLLSAIGVLSGILPNVSGYYDGKRIAPNLFVFIIGGYGSGKGAMTHSLELIKDIDKEVLKESKERLLEWNRVQSLPRKDKAGHPDEFTKEPRLSGIIVPANASSSAFLDMLEHNGGKGILFETEGDTLAQTLTTDHGNYSDILRKAFHHEPTSMARRANNQHTAMPKPKLSVILTGTPNQFKKLIPDTENGLFSRFIYLTIESERGFRDVFNKAKSTYESKFYTLGQQVYKLHHLLRARPEDSTFEFTTIQKKKFHNYYQKEKPNFIGNTGEDAAGVFHRLAFINFRIAMLFSVLSQYNPEQQFNDKIMCKESDFKAAFEVSKILFQECKNVYFDLPEQQNDKEEIDEKINSNDLEVKRIIELRKGGLGAGRISQKLRLDYQIKMGKTKVYGILKALGMNK